MSNWSRIHDAWLARECEGLEVWVNASDGAICDFQDDSIPHYRTDPAAAIRAAEAWRKKIPDQRSRQWSVLSAMLGMKDGFFARLSDCDDDERSLEWYGDTPAAALAQSLYSATGGPA